MRLEPASFDNRPLKGLKGTLFMFARIVECTTKPGNATDLNNTIRNEILPILQSQPGFMDEITLVPTAKRDHLVAVSFWKTSEDAVRYEREQFPQILNKLQSLLKATPKVKTFTVESSTLHKTTTGQAA